MEQKQLLVNAVLNGNKAAADPLLDMIRDDIYRKVYAAAGAERAPALAADIEKTIRQNMYYVKSADRFDQWVDGIINVTLKEAHVFDPKPEPVKVPADRSKLVMPAVLAGGILIGALLFFAGSKLFAKPAEETAAVQPQQTEPAAEPASEPASASDTEGSFSWPFGKETEEPETTAVPEEVPAETKETEAPAVENTEQVQADETAAEASGKEDFYFIPYSNTRVLTESDIIGFTDVELTYARNEIYARHGYSFKSSELREYFRKQSWYVENPSWDPNNLAGIELQNAVFIRDYQYANGKMYDPK
ncbi:MAG: YARHG domain-containing protein [Solobacterium sp.]|nr:YARHG domain-containing protein [Solobacterium sp.]